MLSRKLEISPAAKKCANKAVLVTGSARSGTTIIGKLLSSFDCAEYAYEPPALLTLISAINEIDETQWRMLYEAYLYEEFLLNALAGRVFNFNKFDDSAIFKTKSQEEIDRRLSLNLAKSSAEELASKHTVIYKIPDIGGKAAMLKKYYPSMNIVIMLRDAVGTLNSVIQRGWFNKKNEESNLIWPFTIFEAKRVPFWVLPKDIEYWVGLSEIDRAAYYYVRINEDISNISDGIVIKYSNLIQSPQVVAGNLSEKLGLHLSEKSLEIVGAITKTEKFRDLKIVDKINKDLRDRVLYYSDLST